jgi:D-glycero-D-manno-heptose 1,7-bisphosphate phosphatase
MHESQAPRFVKIDNVFLDREGVLNRKPPEGEYVTRWEEFELLPGVADALSRLKRSGRRLILVSNQRCVALGLCSEGDVRKLHEQLQAHLTGRGAALDAIYFCPHDQGECCCRKPDTGMFEQAFRDFPDANPENSVMIGDSLSDIEAGRRVGMRTIFLAGDPGRQKPGTGVATEMATGSAESLLACVERYLCP